MAKLAIGWAAAVALIGAVAVGTPAHATGAPVTDNFNFNIGPFTGPVPPVPGNWIGSFSVTFDPTTASLTGVALNSFSSNVSTLVTPWDYVVSTSFQGLSGHTVLIIGNDCGNNSGCIDQNGSGFIANTGFIQLDLGLTSSFSTGGPVLAVAAATPTAPVVLAAEYVTGSGTSSANPHYSASVNVLVPANAVTVPEPTSLALLFTGLGALAGLRFRRARASA